MTLPPMARLLGALGLPPAPGAAAAPPPAGEGRPWARVGAALDANDEAIARLRAALTFPAGEREMLGAVL
jgi:hypothetical protein